jgi:hypothetical protein
LKRSIKTGARSGGAAHYNAVQLRRRLHTVLAEMSTSQSHQMFPSGVLVHPADQFIRLLNPIILTENPQTFRPRADPMTGAILTWGIDDGGGAPMTAGALMMRLNRDDSLHRFYGRHAEDPAWKEVEPPELQFVEVLKQNKLEALVGAYTRPLFSST